MKKLLILSGKGGTGKTTTAAAFIHLAQARAFADCDVDAPNLHLIGSFTGEPQTKNFIGSEKAVIDADKCMGCGLCQSKCRFDAIFQRNNIYFVTDYACEGCGLCAYLCPEKAITMTEDVAGWQQLYRSTNDTEAKVFSTAKLKMGRGNSGKLVTAVKTDLIANAPKTDLAIIDGSPGLGCPVIASMNGVDMALIVAEPSLSGRSDLERLIKAASGFRVKLAVCVNKWDTNPTAAQAIEKFCVENNLPFLGRIPYDVTASTAINQGKSIVQFDCPANAALRNIFAKVLQLLELR